MRPTIGQILRGFNFAFTLTTPILPRYFIDRKRQTLHRIPVPSAGIYFTLNDGALASFLPFADVVVLATPGRKEGGRNMQPRKLFTPLCFSASAVSSVDAAAI